MSSASCSLQLAAVLLQQLETELAEDLQEGHIRVLLLSLLRLPKGETYPVPTRQHNTKKCFIAQNEQL